MTLRRNVGIAAALALGMVLGYVARSSAQAPATGYTFRPSQFVLKATGVVENGVPQVRDLVVQFGNGWELRADRLDMGANMTRAGTDQGPQTITEIRSSKMPAEVTLSGNVRLTIGH